MELIQLPTPPNIDPLSYLSNYKIYLKKTFIYIYIYTRTVNNVMVNKNKYFVFQNIQSSNCYFIKFNIMVLLFKYLNNNSFKSLEIGTLLIKIEKSNSMNNIVY